MPEFLLHFIWSRGLFASTDLTSTDGRRIEVLSPGVHNLDAGPDFTGAHLRIDGVEMVGQIEIHVLASDWYRHHHHLDPAYDSVLLHVVRRADKRVYNTQGEALLQLELPYDDDRDYLSRLTEDAALMDSALATHRCGARLLQDPDLLTQGWKHTMLMRLMECKQASIERLLQVSVNDWNNAFYISLAHHFGFHVNGVPMEMLALATPLKCLLKHRDNLFQLTSLLLGQSGLLTETDPEWQEYVFLRTKFSLTPLDAALWKRGRLRPQTQPQVRIRQLARLLHGDEFLFSRCMEATDVKALRALFATTGMGRSSVDSLLINVVVPFLYAQGEQGRALMLLESLPAEENRIIRQWRLLGQSVHNAADTQALIHLYRTCCEPGLCLTCSVWSDHAV